MYEYNPPGNEALELLYIDEYLLVLNKPSGLLSVPGRGEDKQDCLISRVQADYPEALTVHRLDMPTSGIVLMARSKSVQSQLSHLFSHRLVQKSYIAIVAGHPEPETGVIDQPLICDWPNRPRQIIDKKHGKPSRTVYKVLKIKSSDNTARVELIPETGRTHQLRVHMQFIGHPILGDNLYADEQSKTKSDRLLLHATSLTFKHPLTGNPVEITSQVPF